MLWQLGVYGSRVTVLFFLGKLRHGSQLSLALSPWPSLYTREVVAVLPILS